MQETLSCYPKDPFVSPKEGISPIILFWGWDWNPQSYSIREVSRFLGLMCFFLFTCSKPYIITVGYVGVSRDRSIYKSYNSWRSPLLWILKLPTGPRWLVFVFRNVSDNRGGEVCKMSHPYHPCMVYLPTFTTNIPIKCRQIYHTWKVWVLQKPRMNNYVQIFRSSFPEVFGGFLFMSKTSVTPPPPAVLLRPWA